MPVEIFDNVVAGDIRADQDDPWVQYFIVKKSLKMSIGKTSMQCAHAGEMMMIKYYELKIKMDARFFREDYPWLSEMDVEVLDKLNRTNDWLSTSFRKVALAAKDKEFERVKEELDCFLVTDAGLTEVAPNTETVISLWPMRKSKRPKFLQRMRVL